MADEVVSIDIKSDAAQGAQSIGELKKAIKDLQSEALKQDVGSAAYNKLTAF